MMTAVRIDTNIYNDAKLYADEHNTSVKQLLETYILTLMPKRSQVTDKTTERVQHFSPELQKLIGIAKSTNDNSLQREHD